MQQHLKVLGLNAQKEDHVVLLLIQAVVLVTLTHH
jgi:hypothetical protein